MDISWNILLLDLTLLRIYSLVFLLDLQVVYLYVSGQQYSVDGSNEDVRTGQDQTAEQVCQIPIAVSNPLT